MSFPIRIAATVAVISLGTLAGLTACSVPSGTSTGDASSTASASPVMTDSPQVQEPVIVESSALEGQNIETTVGQFIDVVVGDSDPALWTATVATPGVVEFLPGGPDGASIMNPGFAVLMEGTTAVTMTDGTTTINFTVTVTAAPAK